MKYAPPADRWKLLPRTLKRLQQGPTLRVVMLGDSIINDTARSSWPLLLKRHYPKCRIRLTTSVRGSTGCWHYKAPGRVGAYVLDFAPDLVMIGGISQRGDIDSIRQVIRQIRAAARPDIMLMTGPFGRVDPNDDKQWAAITKPPKDAYGARLKALAAEQKTAFLDIQAAWARYVRSSGKETVWFKRDVVHANDRGEQILGRILAGHLAPPEQSGKQGLARQRSEAERTCLSLLSTSRVKGQRSRTTAVPCALHPAPPRDGDLSRPSPEGEAASPEGEAASPRTKPPAVNP